MSILLSNYFVPLKIRDWNRIENGKTRKHCFNVFLYIQSELLYTIVSS